MSAQIVCSDSEAVAIEQLLAIAAEHDVEGEDDSLQADDDEMEEDNSVCEVERVCC